jgi:hypothetical protein
MNPFRPWLLCVLVLSACASPDSTSAPDAGSEPVPSADAGPTEACAQPTGGPTVHPSQVSQNETWTAAASPHVIQFTTRVAAGVTLTLEPCATVLFKQGTSLELFSVGARLVAEGTASKPIRFAGEGGTRWGVLSVSHPAHATLRHVKLSGGGGERFADHATLFIRGDQTTPARRPVLVDHVTIEASQGPGVSIDSAGAFAAGSAELVITGSGSDSHPFPAVLGEHALGSLPTGRYTGNRVDEILLEPEGANGYRALQEDATLRDRGVPYRIGTLATAVFQVGGGTRSPRTVLSIEPGVTLRFAPGARMRIGTNLNEQSSDGVLKAVGTATRPITFTSAADAPAPGDWAGLVFNGTADPETRLEHAVLEYTGNDCGCSLLTCTATAEHEAAITLNARPASVFVRNTRIVHGSGHGVFRSWRGDAAPDFLSTNVFEHLTGCAQTQPMPLAGACTTPRQTCP